MHRILHAPRASTNARRDAPTNGKRIWAFLGSWNLTRRRRVRSRPPRCAHARPRFHHACPRRRRRPPPRPLGARGPTRPRRHQSRDLRPVACHSHPQAPAAVRGHFGRPPERPHDCLICGSVAGRVPTNASCASGVENAKRGRAPRAGMEPQAAAARIAQHRRGILELARRHGASNVRVFGSVARGEPDASDLDLLVTVEPGRSMIDLIRLQLELEDLLKMKVDLVEDKALHPLLREIVLHEAVAV